MKNDFLLYLDILGFEHLCLECDPKVEAIYACLLETKRNHKSAYKVVIFSATVLIQNVGLSDPLYSLMFLCEFFTDLQYRLSKLQIFLRGVIKNGLFTMERREDVEVFYGPAIIAAYKAEKSIKAVGLFMCKSCSPFNQIHKLTHHDEKYDYVQTLSGVVTHSEMQIGSAQIPLFCLTETDEFCFLVDDVELLQQISKYRADTQQPDIQLKHETTWQLIRKCNSELLDSLEAGHFDLKIVNDEFDWSLSGMYR
jgi:hypothetical protein